jgi:prepilin-type N-terminal cleavage/methylation domain-containing protein
MKKTSSKKGFTLVELLATIAIMAVLIVAALPYVADYTSWARATAQDRDAQVVAGAIARWIAVGGTTTTWQGAKLNQGGWTSGAKATAVITSLVAGTTVGTTKDPFLAPNTSWTVLSRNIKIAFTSARDYTVTGRTN